MKALRDEIWGHIQTLQEIELATIDGDRPRVRPMIMIHLDARLFVCTFYSDAKSKQLQENPNIEFCKLIRENRKNGYIRGRGSARFVDDTALKDTVLKMVPPFSNYFKNAKDPNYALIELVLDEIEYMPVGMDGVKRLKF